MANLYKLNSETGAEPITRTEAKNFCKVDSDLTADDDLFDDLIISSRKYAESYCNRAFKDKNITIRINPEDFYKDKIPLTFRADPTGLVLTRIYQGSSSTVSTDIYQLDEYSNMLELKYLQLWPDFEYLTVTYDCYNDSDEQIKKCLLNIVYEDYEYRMNGKPRNRNRINAALDQYRLWMFKG